MSVLFFTYVCTGIANLTIYFRNGITLKYKGNYLNGERNGSGKKYNRRGQIKFEGVYLNGKPIEKE